MSSIQVSKSTCLLARTSPQYPAVVLSYRLVLKLAEILEAKLRKEVKLFVFTECIYVTHHLNPVIFVLHPLVQRGRVRGLKAGAPGGAVRPAEAPQRVERRFASKASSEIIKSTELPKGNRGVQQI